jgi:hypothetical protein
MPRYLPFTSCDHSTDKAMCNLTLTSSRYTGAIKTEAVHTGQGGSPKEMLCKVGALHPGNRCQGNPVAHITDGPDAVHITLAEIVDLDAALVVQLDSQLKGQEGSCQH